MKSCFFLGHRTAAPSILPALSDTIERCIETNHVECFYVGNYGNFDRMAGGAVIAAKRLHPEISLYRVLAYHPSTRHVELPKGFDGLYYPEGLETVPKRFAIHKVNQIMIDQCDYLIAYAIHPASNTSKFLDYARRRGRQIENLGCNLPV